MDKETRNTLRNAVTQCRRILEEAVGERLEGQYGIHASGKIEADAHMGHLSRQDANYRGQLLVHVGHIQAGGYTAKEAVAQLAREVAFTHLNRLVAYKMMERRGLIREAVSRGVKSQGFLFYLADHPEDERLWSGGQPDLAYRHFLEWLGRTFAGEIRPLFAPHDPANPLFPPPRALEEVLARLNAPELAGIWNEDETIGWVYQYFTPDELRREARAASSAPRNSYELAFRNQFYTPRYVVEFLSDNTLGRIWYEMRQGDTRLTEQCRYLVRRPGEVFLSTDYTDFTDENEEKEKSVSSVKSVDRSVNQSTDFTDFTDKEKSVPSVKSVDPILVPFRRKKDPRQLKILDPAGGSGHFLLYCFDLLVTIYEEAYDDPQLGPRLRADYPTLADLRRALPGLILRHNLHLIDIDRRATQIAALALWLRAQRAYQTWEIPADRRPQIRKANIVCAEPMPGDKKLLAEFVAGLNPPLLGQLVRTVFEKMKLAGEAGSLLKIEVELRDAIAKAKREWEELQTGAKGKQMALFAAEPQPEQLGFDLSGISDAEFWDHIEEAVFKSLSDYAGGYANGKDLARQIFAEDTAQGFNFIDLWRKRFDVILMNPPFGASSVHAADYCFKTYPSTYSNIAYSFIERATAPLVTSGLIGCITTRIGFFITTFETWRQDVLSGGRSITVCLDLGYGVLDALVETAAYVLSPSKTDPSSIFLDLLEAPDKETRIQELLSDPASPDFHIVNTFGFKSLAGSPFGYWAPSSLLGSFASCDAFDPKYGEVKRGVATGDNFRFLRLFWEVDPRTIGPQNYWIWYANGGEYSPYYIPTTLLLEWHNDGYSLKNFKDAKGRLRSRPQNIEYFFRPGLTYAARTTSGFAMRVLPAESGFDQTSNPVFIDSGLSLSAANCFLFTRPCQAFVELSIGSGDTSQSGTAARHYTNGLVSRMPIPPMGDDLKASLTEIGNQLITLSREPARFDETAVEFTVPGILTHRRSSLIEANYLHVKDNLERIGKILRLSHLADDISLKAYKIDEQANQFLDRFIGPHPMSYPVNPIGDGEAAPARVLTKKCYWADRDLEVSSHEQKISPDLIVNNPNYILSRAKQEFGKECRNVISYLLGCVLGRWDVSIGCVPSLPANLPQPFDSLPNCPPGMLKNQGGMPATQTPSDYLIDIDWDGILVDDPNHLDDIIRRVQQVLAVIWEERAAAIEQEACTILGVKELRDYFRNTGKGGFWDDHVKRYSKSRRKAPIYWLLQSSKGNYALWLYYHRLDKDLYYKALVNYVEPKLRLEENKLSQLQAQRAAFGTGGKEAKQAEKEIARQDAFLSELRDFHDKLRAVAHLNLTPDLNDGVILNIAPLRELVPWKEAQTMWNELQAGKYEWSSVSQQLKGG